MANSYKDGIAQLAHMFQGKALPEHLARKSAIGGSQAAKDAASANAKTDKALAAKLTKAPLVAVNYVHSCKCGNKWTSFGTYARMATERQDGAADVTYLKPLSYDPSPELPASITWQERQEQVCIQCYGGPEVEPATLHHGDRVGKGYLEALVQSVRSDSLGKAR